MSQSPSAKSTTTAKGSPSRLPAKIGKNLKKIKRQVKNVFHHVTPSKHHNAPPSWAGSLSLYSTPPSSSLPSPVVEIGDYLHSGRNRDTKSQEAACTNSDRTSSRTSLALSEPSSRTSITSISAMSSEAPYHQDSQKLTSTPQEDSSTGEPNVDDSHNDSLSPVPSSPSSEPMFTSPPTVYVEPEVPDPFLIDDEDNSSSDEENLNVHPAPVSESQQTIMPSHEISLTIPASPSVSLPTTPRTIPLPSPNFNKDVPPPPMSDSDPEEDEMPDLYLPGLIIPTMFLPIPNTDPLTTLLTKYIYPPEKRPMRDLVGDWKRSDFHTMVMSNSWRALARMARDRIVTADPENLTLILDLWYLRLSSLARLRLFNQTSAECTNLFVVLNAIEPPEAKTWVFDRILPFELEVMHARLKYWAGDHMGYLDALNTLLRKCRSNARLAKADDVAVSMWKERGARICLIIASQLMEMKDFTAATNLLEPLCKQGDSVSTSALRSSIGRIYLQSGNLEMAAKHFASVAADSTADQATKYMNTALLASAEGDWARASETLQVILEKDAENFVAVNNLSVALLSQGKLKQGIEVLESALNVSPSSVVVAEPFLFNLSTLYELRSATAAEKKRNLLVEVAKWSGDGLKTTCLKMPSN